MRSAIISAAASLVLLAACGGGAAPAASPASSPAGAGGGSAAASAGARQTVPEIAAYQGADRQQILEDGATKEGTVSWYTVLAGEGVDALVNGFQQKYPYLKVDTFRSDTNPLFARMTQEKQANKPSFDVADVTTPSVLAEGGFVTPFYSPGTANIADNLKTGVKGPLVMTASDWTTNASFAYNKTLIPESAVPKKFEDLMNPASPARWR